MTDSRLALALLASLACHALMLALLRGGPQATHLGPAPLIATLLAGGDDSLPAVASPAPPSAATGAAADAAPSSVSAHLPAGLASPLPSIEPLGTEPGSVMSLAPRGSIAYSILYRQKVLGRSVHRWQHDGSSYTINNQTQLLDADGILQRSSATSHGYVSAYGLLPAEFSGDGNQPTLRFDRESFKASQEPSGSGRRPIALETETQDDLSLLYHLGQSLLHGRGLNLSSASAQGLTRHSFELLGAEYQAVAGARRRVLHLRNRDDGAAILEVWISLDQQHLPLRILRRDGLGREIEQVAEKIE